jgi:Na+/H+ antiporter NhaD/arsenite permease-like protein
MAASAFINNTPVVLVMIPVVIALARQLATPDRGRRRERRARPPS